MANISLQVDSYTRISKWLTKKRNYQMDSKNNWISKKITPLKTASEKLQHFKHAFLQLMTKNMSR